MNYLTFGVEKYIGQSIDTEQKTGLAKTYIVKGTMWIY